MWTLDEGRAAVKQVQAVSRDFGYHVALGGGVLNAGKSSKDLDLYFLSLDDQAVFPDSAGLLIYLSEKWGKYHSLTSYESPAWSEYAAKMRFDPLGKRIDVFIVQPKGAAK